MKVHVKPYGLRPFQITEIKKLDLIHCPRQYKGKYLLPDNIVTSTGEAWIELDYWFTDDEIVHTPNDQKEEQTKQREIDKVTLTVKYAGQEKETVIEFRIEDGLIASESNGEVKGLDYFLRELVEHGIRQRDFFLNGAGADIPTNKEGVKQMFLRELSLIKDGKGVEITQTPIEVHVAKPDCSDLTQMHQDIYTSILGSNYCGDIQYAINQANEAVRAYISYFGGKDGIMFKPSTEKAIEG